MDCLPEYYEQIIWFLIEKLGYIESYFDEDISYNVDDSPDKNISINKLEKKTEWGELKC